MPNPKLSFIKYFVDISGTPKPDDQGNYQKVIVGCVSIDQYKLSGILQQIESDFPILCNKKGHKLKPRQLEEIIGFLNKEKVRMITVQFDKEDWEKYRLKYAQESHREEKIMSVLYYYVLKKKSLKSYIYQAVLDSDTSFDIHQSVRLCQRIARERKYNFKISFGYSDINEEIKLADWIASARRKIDIETLEKYENFIILKNNLPAYHLNRVFKEQQ